MIPGAFFFASQTAVWVIACLACALASCACDGRRLTYACTHDPDFDCSPLSAARARLTRAPAAKEDPYDAVEGTCGALRYLQYRVHAVPTDQQEDRLVTQYYDSGGALVAARVADNLDGKGTFTSHTDYGAVPSCALTKTGPVAPTKASPPPR